jgi:DNA-binding IclR family transcriptional regulator
MTEGTTTGNSLSTVERTFEIIELLKEVDGARVSEVADKLDIPKSTAFNYLSTLNQQGYLIKHGDEYQVSLKFLDIGGYAANRKDVYQKAKQVAKQLAQETNERAQLVVKERTYGICMCMYLGDNAVQTNVRIGMRLDLHTTAAGKAILAHLPDEERNELFERRELSRATEHTLTERDQLREELERVRESEVAFNREERIDGQNAVGVPLIPDDFLIGAFSVSGPSHRMKGSRLEETIPDLLLGYVNELELNMTY